MNQHLIAPVTNRNQPAGVRVVNAKRLDDRIEGQRELAGVARKSVIPPSEEGFFAAIESLRWREQHLVTAFM